jgi:hypothetical protein
LTDTFFQTEIKQAKQQSQDLRQTDEFLQTLISSDNNAEKDKFNHKSENSFRQMNGRPKMSRIDPISRFSEPPAPPPQQPLPEKPDVARRTEQPAGSLKRSDTEKPPKDAAPSSPVSKESSQILSLIEALSLTKKELEAQNGRVKELEDLLRQERLARESAEEKSRKPEYHDILGEDGVTNAQAALEQAREENAEQVVSEVEEITKSREAQETDAVADVPESVDEEPLVDAQTQKLQQKLDNMVIELTEMKLQVKSFKQRAEKAEGETAEVRKSLAEMIETIRQERDAAQAKEVFHEDEADVAETHGIGKSDEEVPANRKIRAGTDPHKIQELENAVSSLTQQRKHDVLQSSTPYASMVGVVLLGIGLMAYLNGWQKIER